jgi:hypothetical protein
MTWELTLNRKWYTKNSTIGDLLINGTWFCFILEDVCRDLNRDGDLKDKGEAKVNGKTCIPAGRYQVIITWSNRFKRLMPLLVAVPDFDGIRMHWGNDAVATDGCLLTGSTRAVDFIGHTRDTFDRFFIRLTALLKARPVYITIHDLPLNP